MPPHRKREDDDVLEQGEASPAFQREAWQALSRTITGIVNKVSVDNLEESCTLLFRENLVRGRGLWARSMLRTQQVDPELTSVLASLVSRVNKEFPDVVWLLCRRLVMQWKRASLRKDWRTLENTAKFIANLYLFQVADVGVVYQVILAHLTAESRCDEDVDQAAKVFEETFKAMASRARAEFHEQVLTPFRDLLAMDSEQDRLSTRSQAVLESCLKAVQKWEKVRDEQSYLPERLLLFDLDAQKTHELDFAETYPTEDALDRYSYDTEYAVHEAQYELARKAILGDDWEVRMLEEVAAAEEADEDDDLEAEAEGRHDPEGGDGLSSSERKVLDRDDAKARPSPDHGVRQGDGANGGASRGAPPVEAAMESHAPKALIDAEERELRKEIYLAMRSSVRADEAVHKIRRQMKPFTERTVCFMVIEGCCEERSYKKVYAMAAERLCKSNVRFQAFFVESLRERYEGADALNLKQIEYTAKIFAHLLRTESVYWSRVLGVMDIVRNNESQRLMIQGLFRSLAEEMGMPALLRRLSLDEETINSTRRLFPVDKDANALEVAINLYVAMGLGELAAPLRAALESLRKSPVHGDRKRFREEAEGEDRL